MLSIENQPPESLCHCEISQVENSSSDDHYQHSDNPQLVDLLISSPNFSIRDYVFSTRSKDIKINWPFSQKNLQLCLKHGVRDLLPPFQSVDAVRNPSIKRCAPETSLVDKENEGNLIMSVNSNYANPDLDFVHINPSGPEGEREFPSTVSTQSCSQTDYLPPKKNPSLALEADTLPGYSAKKPVKKVLPAAKKCGGIVKLYNSADLNLKEDSTSNNLLVSETMASKICPVCKTFTSSSNTTLNAHIDQCLCSDSMVKSTAASPMVIKPRIKPRKMKSMVDIYATASYCTIEELDRRNGTTWASGSSLHAQEIQAGASDGTRKYPVDFEDIENDSAVYVDANGTKVRILSKLDDLPSIALAEHSGPRKFATGYTGGKHYLTKKKKQKHPQGHDKFQIHVSGSKKFCSTRLHQISQINDGQEQTDVPELCEIEERHAQPRGVHNQVKLKECETIGWYACYKRTSLSQMNGEEHHQNSASTGKKQIDGEDNEDPPWNSHVTVGCVSRGNRSSANPPSSPRSSEPHDEYGRVLSLRKRARVPSGSESLYDHNNHPGMSEGRGKQSKEDAVRSSRNDDPESKLNSMSCLSSQKVKMKRALTRNAYSCDDNSKKSSPGHKFLSKSKSFSSSRKHQVSVSQPSVSESKFSSKRKCLALKRPSVHCDSKSDGEEIVKQTVSKSFCNVAVERCRLSKLKKETRNIRVSRKEVVMVCQSMKSTSKYHEHDDEAIYDSSPANVIADAVEENDSTGKEVQSFGTGVAVESASDMPCVEACTGIRKSSDVHCSEVAGFSDVQSGSRQFIELYGVPFLGTEEDSRGLVESILGGGGKIFFTDGGDRNITGQDVHIRNELDSNDGTGTWYAEVDPIPIPGPPGSFLPSPGHMNSSVTSSQVLQSSENHREFACRDSSNSPSATSTISVSDVAKFDSRLLEKYPFGHSVHDEIRSNVSGVTGDAVVDNTRPDQCAAYPGGERPNSVEPKGDQLFLQTVPLIFKNDQLCCCSRKEGAELHSAVLHYQDNPLFRRGVMPYGPESSVDGQVNSEEIGRMNDCNIMLEVLSSSHLPGTTQNACKDPLGLIPCKACANSEASLSVNSDRESCSPSTSNPILRLMGKDLMVVNKAEIVLPQHRPTQAATMKRHENSLSSNALGVSSGIAPSCDLLPFNPVVSQSYIIKQTPGSTAAQHVDPKLSNGYNKGTFSAPQIFTHASSLVLQGKTPGSHSGTSKTLGYLGGCVYVQEQLRAVTRLGGPLINGKEKANQTSSQGQNIDCSHQTVREIIVIDDASESAVDLTSEAMHGVRMINAFGPSARATFLGPRRANSLPHTSHCASSPVVQGANFQMPPAMGAYPSPIKWNCVSADSELAQKGSFSSSSSATATNQMKSEVYNPAGFA